MRLILLTDGSVNPKRGVGFGAYLAFTKAPEHIDDLSDLIKVKRFEDTSSTKLELQTLLWALSEISEREVVSYTDSQNIPGLLSRKDRLVANRYCSKNGRRIRNHALYKAFFESTEQFDIQFHLLSGHMPSRCKHRIDEMFSLVDRAARNALRSDTKSSFQPIARK
jgi:ribonuclease HI